MSIRPVRLFGDPVLRTRADEVTAFDDSLEQLVSDMLDTMDEQQGVGLAANQIGVLRRVFVYDCSHEVPGARGHVINPVWEPIDVSEVEEVKGADYDQGEALEGEPSKVLAREGCLSIPGVYEEVERHEAVIVRGVTKDNEPVEFKAKGLLARCIQHETDHLDGVLFLQRLTPERRKRAMKTIRESEWFI